MKKCLDCDICKSLEEFPHNKNMADGRGAYCKPCMAVRSRESYRRTQARKGKAVREKEDLPDGCRRCADCGSIKPLVDFPRNKNTKDGRHAYCKPCHNARGRESKQRLYGGSRHYHLVRRYGISAAEVQRMVAAQEGLCAICRENPAEHVDHRHDTGAVRGILCFSCNGGLGQFRDRVDILLRAIGYLERTREPTWQSSDFTDGSPPPTQRQGAAPSPTSSGRRPPTC